MRARRHGGGRTDGEEEGVAWRAGVGDFEREGGRGGGLGCFAWSGGRWGDPRWQWDCFGRVTTREFRAAPTWMEWTMDFALLLGLFSSKAKNAYALDFGFFFSSKRILLRN